MKTIQANQLPEYSRGSISVYRFEDLTLEYNETTKEWSGEYYRWDEEEEDWAVDRKVLPGEMQALLDKYQPITKKNIEEYELPSQS